MIRAIASVYIFYASIHLSISTPINLTYSFVENIARLDPEKEYIGKRRLFLFNSEMIFRQEMDLF